MSNSLVQEEFKLSNNKKCETKKNGRKFKEIYKVE